MNIQANSLRINHSAYLDDLNRFVRPIMYECSLYRMKVVLCGDVSVNLFDVESELWLGAYLCAVLFVLIRSTIPDSFSTL